MRETISEREIDEFIAAEKEHHPEGYLTREKAKQFIIQRRNAACLGWVHRPPKLYTQDEVNQIILHGSQY